MKYKSIRQVNLAKWLSNSNRLRNGVHESFNNSIECKWQRKAKELDLGHISVFCGLGRFNANITDILTDERFDDLNYTVDKDKKAIIRQYCKLGLIVSESLTDFQDLLKVAKKQSAKAARKKVSKVDLPDAVDKLIMFFNHVFKHKCNGVYLCDHHTYICFDDLGRDCCNGNILDISCASKETCELEIHTIIIPKMEYVVERVIQAYHKLDEYFDSNPDAFKAICEKYSDQKNKAA